MVPLRKRGALSVEHSLKPGNEKTVTPIIEELIAVCQLLLQDTAFAVRLTMLERLPNLLVYFSRAQRRSLLGHLEPLLLAHSQQADHRCTLKRKSRTAAALKTKRIQPSVLPSSKNTNLLSERLRQLFSFASFGGYRAAGQMPNPRLMGCNFTRSEVPPVQKCWRLRYVIASQMAVYYFFQNCTAPATSKDVVLFSV